MSTVVTECMTTAEIRSSFYTEVFCSGRLRPDVRCCQSANDNSRHQFL